MTPTKKKRTNYQFRLMSNIKTWAIGILTVALAVSSLFAYMKFRDNIKMTIMVQESEDKVDDMTDEWLPVSLQMFETNNMTWEKYMAEVKANDSTEEIGLWEEIVFSAYSSQDEGVDNYAADGTDIAKYSMTRNFAAVAKSSYADIGDIILVKWWKDLTIMPWLIVDICPVCEPNNPEKAEIDLYFGADYLDAVNFGKQKMDTWIIKSQAIASREK